MTSGRLFLAIGVASLLAGAGFWTAFRPSARADAGPALEAPMIAPAALLATRFVDDAGRERSLAEFPGKVLVVNFWATWCAPCRAEMPAFDRLNERWSERGVQFVGLSAEPSQTASAFGKGLAVRYPLWTGADGVSELSRRLGNQAGALPHTVILTPEGRIEEQRVGPYTEAELESVLARISPKKS